MASGRGRSKGCFTCRRRKVKCDETRPLCDRCRNAYMICEGYASDAGGVVFVDQSRRFQGRTRGHFVPLPETDAVGSHVVPRCETDVGIFRHYDSASSPCPSVGLEGFRENIWISFLTATMFNAGPTYPMPLGTQSWILHLLTLDSTSAAHSTVCSLAAAIFARTHGMSDADWQSGAKYYEKALCQLNKNLRGPDWQNPTNVAIVYLLGIYELTAFNNGRGWIQHAGGIGKLIERRGAKAHTQEPARFYFKMCRMFIVPQALIFRRATFLEGREWLDISKTVEDGDERFSYRIMEIMSQLPGILEEHDRTVAFIQQPSEETDDGFERRLIRFLVELFAWRFSFERYRPNVAFEILAMPYAKDTADENGVPLFNSILGFKHHLLSNEILLYNTALLYALDLAKTRGMADVQAQALAQIQDLSTINSTNPLKLPHQGITAESAVEEICRIVEFHMHGEQLTGALQLILPLRTVFTFTRNNRVRQWLGAVVKKIATVKGFSFAQRIRSVEHLAHDSSL